MCCKEGESEGKDTALYGPSHANIHFDLKIIIFFSLFPLSRWGLKYEVWCINRLGAEKKVRNSFFLSDHSFMVISWEYIPNKFLLATSNWSSTKIFNYSSHPVFFPIHIILATLIQRTFNWSSTNIVITSCLFSDLYHINVLSSPNDFKRQIPVEYLDDIFIIDDLPMNKYVVELIPGGHPPKL